MRRQLLIGAVAQRTRRAEKLASARPALHRGWARLLEFERIISLIRGGTWTAVDRRPHPMASASVTPVPVARAAARSCTRPVSTGPASTRRWTSISPPGTARDRRGSNKPLDRSPGSTRTAAFFHDYHHHSFDHTHDRAYQRWLADLTAVVKHQTWSALPALLRFPHAEPDVVLQLAAGEGQTALVKRILESFPGAVEPWGPAAAGAAVTAASRGHHNVVVALLDHGLCADAVDEHDVALILAAAGASDVCGEGCAARCVRTLLERGADANASASRKGWKPLMAAAKTGESRVAELLLNAGADVEARYPNGKTPLYCAAEWGHVKAVEVLLAHGARPDVAADRLMTDHTAAVSRGVLPAEVAARNGHKACADLLFEANAGARRGRGDAKGKSLEPRVRETTIKGGESW